MSASNYPQALDTDTNLIRVLGTDALIPAQHNNMVDAVESIELTAGVVDNTLHSTISPQWSAPLVDQLGIISVAGRNPRYPFGNPVSTDLYCINRALPSGTTLDSGLTTDFSADAPYLRLDSTSAVGVFHVMHIPLMTGALSFVARVALRGDRAGHQTLAFGCKQLAHTGFTGLVFGPNDGLNFYVDGTKISGDGSGWGALWQMQNFMYVQAWYDSAHWHWYFSTDGIRWAESVPLIGSVTPAEWQLGMWMNSAFPGRMWVDFLQQGTVQIGA